MKNTEKEINLGTKHLTKANTVVFDYYNVIFYCLVFTAFCCYFISFMTFNVRAKIGWFFYGIILFYQAYILL